MKVMRGALFGLLFTVLGFWLPVDALVCARAEEKVADVVPQVSQEMKAKVADLQQQAAGYQRAIAVLQEKLDAVTMEYGRTMQSLQNAQPGYELTPQLIYKAKPKPDDKQK